MRLIDADKLILHLNDYALGEAPDERESAGERRISKATYNTIQNCIKAVENQKTELDIDEMTERLEDYLFEKYCIEGDSEIWEIIKDSGVDGTAWIPVTERLPKDEKNVFGNLGKNCRNTGKTDEHCKLSSISRWRSLERYQTWFSWVG